MTTAHQVVARDERVPIAAASSGYAAGRELIGGGSSPSARFRSARPIREMFRRDRTANWAGVISGQVQGNVLDDDRGAPEAQSGDSLAAKD
jgi:hypothetical protein